MAGFISDLLVGIPVLSLPNDSDDIQLNTGPMLQGLREALGRLNVELEFVRELQIARAKIEELEKKIADSADLYETVQKQQTDANVKMTGAGLQIDELQSRMDAAEDAARSGSRPSDRDPLAGHPKDLPKWSSNGQPFAQWKKVFVAGLDGIKPGLKELLKFIAEDSDGGTKVKIEIKIADVGIKDSYSQLSSTLQYHLTQKCADHASALEIIDDGSSTITRSRKLGYR